MYLRSRMHCGHQVCEREPAISLRPCSTQHWLLLPVLSCFSTNYFFFLVSFLDLRISTNDLEGTFQLGDSVSSEGHPAACCRALQ